MTYQLTDITELIHYHLVVSASDDETADNNLRRLVHEIEGLATTPLWRREETSFWTVCEECGTWVSSELIGSDGAGDDASGAFCCTECRFGEAVGDD